MQPKHTLDRIKALAATGSAFKPHKLLMLLTVLDAIRDGDNDGNRFYYDAALRTRFGRRFDQYHGDKDRKRPLAPFFHLRSSGLWVLHAMPGRQTELDSTSTVGSTHELDRLVDYASLTTSFYELVQTAQGYDAARDLIVALLEQRLGNGADPTPVPARAPTPTTTTRTVHEDTTRYTAAANSLFGHEANAIRLLENRLPTQARVVGNLNLHDRQSNRYFECDAIVVSRSGLYIVELKHWSGHIQIAPGSWLVNHYNRRPDPHKNNAFKCKLLKGHFEHRFAAWTIMWVESIVLLTNPDATVLGADRPTTATDQRRGNLTFGSIDDFCSFISKRDAQADAGQLTSARIEAVARWLLAMESPPAGTEYTVPGYVTKEYLYQSAERIELVAAPQDGRTRGLRRFRVFRPPPGARASERQRAALRANSTMDAVDKIGDCPYILPVTTRPNDVGDIIEESVWPKAGTLEDTILSLKGAMNPDIALEICRQIALGLAACHESGIIHRNVRPSNILYTSGMVKLMNFDYAFYLDRRPGELTVLPTGSSLPNDAYTAPELHLGHDADESTDLFGLAVIAYRLLTGSNPVRSSRQLAGQGGALTEQQRALLLKAAAPKRALEVIAALIAEPDIREAYEAQGVAAALAIARDERLPEPSNARLTDDQLSYDLYEIQELLGQGAEAQTYRALAYPNKQVAIKLFHHEVPRERAWKERTYGIAIDSPNVVGCDGHVGNWQGERFFIVMPYVQGISLRAYINEGMSPDPETFVRTAETLLDALEAIHECCDPDQGIEGLVHGDVKPDNILITDDWDAKLIDLGVAAPPGVYEFAGTSGYVPPDKIVGSDMQFSPDGDLYALGVTLYEWATGARPGQSGVNLADSELEPWAKWLERAAAPKSKDRYANVSDMREALRHVTSVAEPEQLEKETPKLDETPPEQGTGCEPDGESQTYQDDPPVLTESVSAKGNPFVAYLNTLVNTSAGNENATAEAQARHRMFPRIRVPNPLTESIQHALVDDHRNVILTGNAGDGKTTIAAEIYQSLVGHPMPAEAVIDVPNYPLCIIKDMSELPLAQRIDVLEQAVHDEATAYLVITNTGTLLECANRAAIPGTDRGAAQSELLAAMEQRNLVPVLAGTFSLLNIGRIDSIETALTVLDRMIEPENWSACDTCPIRDQCPLCLNIELLQSSQAVMRYRTGLVYRRLYEYDTRLTMRQMTAHLAYALTAGQQCDDLMNMSLVQLEQARKTSLYSDRFFGHDGAQEVDEADQLLPIRKLREQGFGVMLSPEFERSIWQCDIDTLPMSTQAREAWRTVRGLYGIKSRWARHQVRRLCYMFAQNDLIGPDDVERFLDSPFLTEYTALGRGQTALSTAEESDLRRRVLHVLHEEFLHLKLPEASSRNAHKLYVTLNQNGDTAATQVVLASFDVDDFCVKLRPQESACGPIYSLLLEHDSGCSLELDLPFMDYVEQRDAGQLDSQISAYYASRLERFQADLLAACDNNERDGTQLDLVRIDANRTMQTVTISFAGNHLEAS